MQFIFMLMGLTMFGWAAYQISRGEAYTHIGSKFSPIEWIPKNEDPMRFWGTVVGQFTCAILVVVVAIARF